MGELVDLDDPRIDAKAAAKLELPDAFGLADNALERFGEAVRDIQDRQNAQEQRGASDRQHEQAGGPDRPDEIVFGRDHSDLPVLAELRRKLA